MREKIFALLLTAFLVKGANAIPKDSIIYSFKTGVISPYCFKYNKRYSDGSNLTRSYPFNSGLTLGLDASLKNFSLEFSLDHSSFRHINHYSTNEVTEIPFNLTQLRLLPIYRILHKTNSSLNIGCGLTLARTSTAFINNNLNKRYYLILGNGICYTVNYTYQLPKRRSSFYAGFLYEKLNNDYSWGPLSNKYDKIQFQHVPIYMVSLGVKYKIGRR
jgi:hypothetical protein